MARLRARRPDHESAERLGGRQARCAAGGGAVLDARDAGGAERPLRAVPAVLLGHLEFQQEQISRQEPAGAPLPALVGREDGAGERRLRSAVLREVHRLSDLGRGRPAEGYALSLPEPLPSPDPDDRRLAGPAQDRRSNLHPGHHDQAHRAAPAGRVHGKGAHLGGKRDRRLHADLSWRPCVGSSVVDAALKAPAIAGHPRRRTAFRRAMARKSTIAFLMTLPLILLLALFVLYPAVYSIHLATLNKSMERFVGFGNFLFLFKRETFWMVV